MNKFFIGTMMLFGAVFVSCDNHEDLWNAIDDVNARVDNLETATSKLNEDIATLSSLMNALQNNISITSIQVTPTGYDIIFSDGSVASINHGINGLDGKDGRDGLDGRDGKDGKDGKDGLDGQNGGIPDISVKQDEDGNFYWTLNGEWLLFDGQKIRANGVDGSEGCDGKDGVDGKNGKDGIDGKDGNDGKDGKDGIDGKDGKNGTNGLNGKDGADGKDGKNGLNGTDGKNGKDAIAPQIRVNSSTNEWEISVDGGITWQSTGINANGAEGVPGKDGDSFFKSIEIGVDEVTFILSNGEQFSLPFEKNDNKVKIIDEEGNDPTEKTVEMEGGRPYKFTISSGVIVDSKITGPKGWDVTLNGAEVSITPPKKFGSADEKNGEVTIILTSLITRGYDEAKTTVITFNVSAYELRVLTFEDEDVRFSPYDMPRDETSYYITKWSDLIDYPQFGGPMLYGEGEGYDDCGHMEEPYFWYDENNTELRHSFPQGYGSTIYWSGGHAISNYASRDIEQFYDKEGQLTVYGDEGAGGHMGSSNFAVHFGYIDGSPWNFTTELPALTFGDGEERIIDHLWVMPNTYALSCYTDGNYLTSQLGPDDYVEIIATGFDAMGEETGETRVNLAEGDQNIVLEWTKFDLSVLGKVARVEFNVLGSNDNGYGFSQPAYFCYDDVAVRFY